MAKKTDCAWCLQEEDTLKDQGPTDSHGICEDHSNEMLYNFQLSRFNRVPSYCEQNAWEFAHESEGAEV